jgi:isoleucyl-tRNA synthetase
MSNETFFEPVRPQRDAVGSERDVLGYWKENDIFQRSMDERKGGKPFVFYEGPPTANGNPHIGHVITRVYKDVFPRYHTMKGRFVRRKAGWDTHGLPVEIQVEKELGLNGKEQVEKYGIAEFNRKCREAVWRAVDVWEDQTERLAYWVNLDEAYVTMTNNYVESVWAILKKFWDDELLYRGYKVVPYCPRCGTPLSSHEVSQGYEDVYDPSFYVKFPVKGEENTFFLVWTTTPWTLPGNAALGVGANIPYLLVEHTTAEGKTERLYVAQTLAEKVLPLGGVTEWTTVGTVMGSELAGKDYEPLFNFLPFTEKAHYVLAVDFASDSDGTGIVHLAPAFGTDDNKAGRDFRLPTLMTVAPDGKFIPEVTPYAGMFVKDADPIISADLKARGLVHYETKYLHSYPFCWRCKTPLLYYARATWFIETTRYKQQLIDNNNKINWMPDHIRTGRFGDWLENNVDWALGRERYWATPLPVWVCDSCNHAEGIGSVKELEGKVAQDLKELDLHRPYVDEVTWACSACEDGTMKRVPEVIDVWFDSGAMPYAQWHYPFENADLFEEQYPADYICEAIDQTRGWFYSLHAISTLLYNRPAFNNVIVLGHVLDENGKKQSKSLGNVVAPDEVLLVHGADATRWYFFSANPPWQSTRFSVNAVGNVVRQFMSTLWNTYSFFVTYANIAGWSPSNPVTPPQERQLLDRWLLSELNQLVKTVDEGLGAYDATGTSRAIQSFVEQLSNWYVRRSRDRFWSEDSAALATLYETLKTLTLLIAPYMPFMAEQMWQNLKGEGEADSVHLAFFPTADESLIDKSLSAAMASVQKVASLGHAARQASNLKVRQPLQKVVVALPPHEAEGLRGLADELLGELNVKEVEIVEGEALATYRIGPDPAVYGKQLGKAFPRLRQVVAQSDQTQLALALLRGENATLDVDGQTVTLVPGTVMIVPEPKAGYAVQQEGAYTVGVTTELTPELMQEGLAREVARQLNQLRKDADLALTDRIEVWVDGDLNDVLDTFGEWIAGETLAATIHRGVAPTDTATTTVEVDGKTVTLALRK